MDIANKYLDLYYVFIPDGKRTQNTIKMFKLITYLFEITG